MRRKLVDAYPEIPLSYAWAEPFGESFFKRLAEL